MRGYLMIFLITFLAEMGDKTQISSRKVGLKGCASCMVLLIFQRKYLSFFVFF